jgi:hypothetical protein
MNPVTTFQIHPENISAVIPNSPITAAPPEDILRFQQALVRHAKNDGPRSDLIARGIAVIEKQDHQYQDAMTKITRSTPGSASTSSVLDFVSTQIQLRTAYETEARVMSVMAQNINELTHLQ